MSNETRKRTAILLSSAGLILIVIGAVVTSHQYEAQIAKRDALIQSLIADEKQTQEKLSDLADASTKAELEAESQLRACRADASGSAADARNQLQDAERQRQAAAFRDSWYTLVYEPGAAAPASPLVLLDIVKPGLGTLLSKLQNAPQLAGMQLRYVLHGIVNPASAPQGSKFVRTLAPPAQEGN